MKRFNNFVEEYKQQRKEAKKAKLQKKYEVKPFSKNTLRSMVSPFIHPFCYRY